MPEPMVSAVTSRRPVDMPATEDFTRFEFKYVLDAATRREIEAEVAHFMSVDGHVRADLDNSYLVRSLYFDNASASHYHEKIDGIRVRRKFRLRTYGRLPADDLPIYLEEKGRRIERTYKHRIQINPEHLEIFSDPDRHDELLAHYPGVDLVEAFLFDSLRRAVRPCVLVDYVRRPYTSPFDMNFRVTFDGGLAASASQSLFPAGEEGWRQSLAGHTILEVKFHRRIPAWFHRILQAHDMRRLSISKFCKGMEACGLAVDLS